TRRVGDPCGAARARPLGTLQRPDRTRSGDTGIDAAFRLRCRGCGERGGQRRPGERPASHLRGADHRHDRAGGGAGGNQGGEQGLGRGPRSARDGGPDTPTRWSGRAVKERSRARGWALQALYAWEARGEGADALLIAFEELADQLRISPRNRFYAEILL